MWSLDDFAMTEPEDPKICPLLEKCADKEDISRVLMAIADHWKAIAKALGLDDRAIQMLEGEKSAPGNKLKAVVSQWSGEGNTTTWGGLVSMLQSIECAPKKIFQKLAEDKFYNKYK